LLDEFAAAYDEPVQQGVAAGGSGGLSGREKSAVESAEDDQQAGSLPNAAGPPAQKKIGVNVPVVVRMEGTNVEMGKQILADAGLNFTSASDLSDAAAKIAAAVN